MSDDLNKLLSNASSSLNSDAPILNKKLRTLGGALENDLLNMLSKRNGFYALESALHVFPSHSSDQIGLDQWNDDELWRSEYDDLTYGCLFFAEDIFGVQFCIKDNKIYTFDPETAALEHIADDIEGWASKIIANYKALTGYPLAHLWQKQYGEIQAGKRLLPKIPFVVGGEFNLDNLYLSDAVTGMKFRASIAKQIRDLPDGTEIKFDIK